MRRDERHYRAMLQSNPSAGVGANLAARAVWAAAHIGEDASHANAGGITRRLHVKYGETLRPSQVEQEMDAAAAEAVRALRARRGWTQTQLAEALGYADPAGAGHSMISRIETGRSRLGGPAAALFRRIAEVDGE